MSKEILAQMKKGKLINKKQTENIFQQMEPLNKEMPRSLPEAKSGARSGSDNQELMGESSRKQACRKKSKS